jgi:hypothetical protein
MKKKRAFAFVLVLAIFSACKETNPPIDFGKDGVSSLKHICYSLDESQIPDASLRGILIEDLTGVSCVACPNAAVVIDSIKEHIKPNPIVALGLYTLASKTLTLPFAGYLDMRTETAQLIGENIYGFSNNLPAGGVCRKLFSGETQIKQHYSVWETRAKTLEGTFSIVNVDIKDTALNERKFYLDVKFTFTSDAIASPFVSVFLLEDGIIHPQKYLSKIDSNYVHDHVVRKEITPYNGSPLLVEDCDVAKRGVVIEKSWSIDVPEDIDLDKTSLVVLVNYNDGDNKEVIQCTTRKLKQ